MLDTNKVRVSKRKEITEKSPTLVRYGVQADYRHRGVQRFCVAARGPRQESRCPRVQGSTSPRDPGVQVTLSSHCSPLL